ncbi:polysaccharide deacetylase family protein [Lysinibacillus sp. 54212]|uniref:polysaccharide deacetylase family protein n=1 Tax=Lysinibacillus sp. 54212 TaxID=3119829 RepID=UPI002FC81056
MKRNGVIPLLVAILLISLFFVNFSNASNKGRKYYEETGEIVWDIKTKDKFIALTFDDGPHPIYTIDILEELAKYDAKATFFIVGKHAEKNPQIVYRMYEEGHELANHTYAHPLKAPVPRLIKEIRQTNEIIFSITGYSPTLFRPVEGQYTDPLIKEVVKDGYKVVMWSWHIDTLDWKNPGVKSIVNTVLKRIGPGNVILFHDGGGNREQTVKALKEILPSLQNEGYQFLTVSELLEQDRKNIKSK